MKDTLQKAYGNIPKEVSPWINFDFFPFKYFKVKPGLLQKFLLGLAGVFGNVVWVIEFRLKAIK